MELNDYERKHSDFIRENGAECTVLLKTDGCFPLQAPGKIALYGGGARRTIKGGTGSGEVNSRYFVTAEQGLQNAGFEIVTSAWMNAYEDQKSSAKEQFLKDLRKEAKEKHVNVIMYSMGRTAPEPNYDIPLSGEADTAVYMLSRNSGEGSDRQAVEGDILLSQTEIRDILACNEKYDNFMLVINAGGVVDLTPVKDVKNILILSQLGTETGNILADILLGKQNPSGKLTTTWAAWNDYCQFGQFGELNDTHYNEGIYVGYRYFDTVKKQPLFPFGFGLSYTQFSLSDLNAALQGDLVSVTAKVKNTGKYAGKETLQLYVSIPSGKLDEPFQELCGFTKTGLLAPDHEENVTISFSMRDIAPYDEETASYILEAGDYVLRLGCSSQDTAPCAIVRLSEGVTVLQAKNVLGKPGFEDWKPSALCLDQAKDLPILQVEPAALQSRKVDYALQADIDPIAKTLTDDQLIRMNIGAFDPNGGIASMIGDAGLTVAGAAGQTVMDIDKVPSMVMADGPAGLRLSCRYAVDKNGSIHALASGLPESILDFLPGAVRWVLNLMNYRPRKNDQIKYQYATAIPIGTAIAQSFNPTLAENFGKIVGEEMELFGVHLWLAPALNIHRDIRCGRNFEYFSEDPLISGMIAAAITNGVQSFPHTGTTIKHYAFNNQERNRTMNNSCVSERAAREIYLKGFGICVRNSQPKALMTSYNLVNGIHTSEHSGLIGDILRAEFGYQGIVMTDWVIAAMRPEPGCTHPAASADRVCMAGGDLFMPGSKHDFDQIKKGLAEGTVTIEQLQINAARVIAMAKKLVM